MKVINKEEMIDLEHKEIDLKEKEIDNKATDPEDKEERKMKLLELKLHLKPKYPQFLKKKIDFTNHQKKITKKA